MNQHFFSLESGGAELAVVFPGVELHIFENSPRALEVTSIPELIAYHESHVTVSPTQRETLAACYAVLQEQGDGSIPITKAVGMFIAQITPAG